MTAENGKKERIRILVVAGTADAREIIEELLRLGAGITATVATGLGTSLLRRCEGLDIREGRLTPEGMLKLLEEIDAACLIDASHPFAQAASSNAMEACKRLRVPYLRYERPKTEYPGEGVLPARDFEEAAARLEAFEGNILLAIGSSKLENFTKIRGFKKRVFVRVLPESTVLKKCEALGLDAENILAVKGPFSEGMNLEMLRHCRASVMVTKDSGSVGGNAEKISAARKLGLPVIMIERPRVNYPRVANTVGEVADFVSGIRAGGCGE